MQCPDNVLMAFMQTTYEAAVTLQSMLIYVRASVPNVLGMTMGFYLLENALFYQILILFEGFSVFTSKVYSFLQIDTYLLVINQGA